MNFKLGMIIVHDQQMMAIDFGVKWSKVMVALTF
jgi:hypothetical protein